MEILRLSLQLEKKMHAFTTSRSEIYISSFKYGLNDNYFCINNLNTPFKKRFIIPHSLVTFSCGLYHEEKEKGRETKLVTRNLLANIFLNI